VGEGGRGEKRVFEKGVIKKIKKKYFFFFFFCRKKKRKKQSYRRGN